MQYHAHAKEVNAALPPVPIVAMKSANALNDSHPSSIVIPRAFVAENATDYEAELAIIIGRECKDVAEDDALDYCLG